MKNDSANPASEHHILIAVNAVRTSRAYLPFLCFPQKATGSKSRTSLYFCMPYKLYMHTGSPNPKSNIDAINIAVGCAFALFIPKITTPKNNKPDNLPIALYVPYPICPFSFCVFLKSKYRCNYFIFLFISCICSSLISGMFCVRSMPRALRCASRHISRRVATWDS